jgi:hypothetical protein
MSKSSELNVFYFKGIVHPAGLQHASDIKYEGDDILQDDLDKLDLVGYPITDGHPPQMDSVVNHPHIVRGKVIHQMPGPNGQKMIIAELMVKGMLGIKTKAMIENGTTKSLSLGMKYRMEKDASQNVSTRFIPDHIAIVDIPGRRGCHIIQVADYKKIETNIIKKQVSEYVQHLLDNDGNQPDPHTEHANESTFEQDKNSTVCPQKKIDTMETTPATNASAATPMDTSPATADGNASGGTPALSGMENLGGSTGLGANGDVDPNIIQELKQRFSPDELAKAVILARQQQEAANAEKSNLSSQHSKMEQELARFRKEEQERKQKELEDSIKRYEQAHGIMTEYMKQQCRDEEEVAKRIGAIADPKDICKRSEELGIPKEKMANYVSGQAEAIEIMSQAAFQPRMDTMHRNNETAKRFRDGGNSEQTNKKPRLGAHESMTSDFTDGKSGEQLQPTDQFNIKTVLSDVRSLINQRKDCMAGPGSTAYMNFTKSLLDRNHKLMNATDPVPEKPSWVSGLGTFGKV